MSEIIDHHHHQTSVQICSNQIGNADDEKVDVEKADIEKADDVVVDIVGKVDDIGENVFDIDIDIDIEIDKFNQSFQSFQSQPFHSGTTYDKMKSMNFSSPTTNKNKLILDLDETLIHTIVATNYEEICKYSTQIGLLFSYSEMQHRDNPFIKYTIFVFERPYMREFLIKMYNLYDIYIYTNGTHIYAKRILSMIECSLGFNPFIEYYTRQEIYPNYIKSLRNINGYTEGHIHSNNTIIIDDTAEVWPEHQNNLIVIKKWYGPKINGYEYDIELYNLIYILTHINTNIIIKNMKITDLINYHKISTDTIGDQCSGTSSSSSGSSSDMILLEKDTDLIAPSHNSIDNSIDIDIGVENDKIRSVEEDCEHIHKHTHVHIHLHDKSNQCKLANELNGLSGIKKTKSVKNLIDLIDLIE